MTKSTKCAVKNCENHEHEGKFVGLLCSPCHTFVAGDGGLYSQAYRNSQEMINVAVKMEHESTMEMLEYLDMKAHPYHSYYKNAAACWARLDIKEHFGVEE